MKFTLEFAAAVKYTDRMRILCILCKQYSLAYEYVYTSDGLNCDGNSTNGYMSKYTIAWHTARETDITFTSSRRIQISEKIENSKKNNTQQKEAENYQQQLNRLDLDRTTRDSQNTKGLNEIHWRMAYRFYTKYFEKKVLSDDINDLIKEM